jgi:hypothetical protein
MAWYTPIIDNFKEIPDDVKKTLTGLLYGFIGFLSSFAIEWYKKRRNPKEVDTEISTKLVISAKDNVEIAQNVIDLLEERLKSEREYYDSKINQSKTDCEEQIMRLKNNYDKALYEVQKKNEDEKKELSDKIDQLQLDKQNLQKEVAELRERLKQYENDVKRE